MTPVREEQLQERVGEHFHELDNPSLLECPTGDRAALLFVIEEESDPRRFSIHRLVVYCSDLAELCQTEQVVSVAVFPHGGPTRRSLELHSDRHTCLSFPSMAGELGRMSYRRYRDSDNLVARLNLRNDPAERVHALPLLT
jgi:hypothetical protein